LPKTATGYQEKKKSKMHYKDAMGKSEKDRRKQETTAKKTQ
jgi:hypothetical protein